MLAAMSLSRHNIGHITTGEQTLAVPSKRLTQ